GRVNLHGKMQSTSHTDEIAEEIVLKIPVLCFRGTPAAPILLVDSFGRLFWRIAKVKRSKVADLKLNADASMLLVVFDETGCELEVVVECRRKLSQAFLDEFAVQLLLLHRNIDCQIPVARDHCVIVERKE